MTDEQKDAVTGKPTKAEPSGSKSEVPTTGETKVTTAVPEKAVGQINPSSPADTGTTPGSVAAIG